MIDLDRPARYPADRTSPGGWRRLATARALATVVAGALLTGAVLGGVAMYLGWYRPLAASVEQAERADGSAVALLLFAEPGVRTGPAEPRRVRIAAQVTVVNAGPEPVDVRAVRVDQPGVTVRSPETERQIHPGTAVPVDVVVEWTCAADPPRTLAGSVHVETVDEQVRTVSPVEIRGTSWMETGSAGCAAPG
ncbi:hypothetical protein [Jidongwangia harbinensis]|uniref:hypothetical protein n=1 Tax=Jidongwangia harbinensis TaxID=2878561 RepID=UPI001CD9D003|nr:hypothetical protein [Jidongwangia harbinensis]MCA2211291.1 hypothetical protein [Jidongwangia harbinensis]